MVYTFLLLATSLYCGTAVLNVRFNPAHPDQLVFEQSLPQTDVLSYISKSGIITVEVLKKVIIYPTPADDIALTITDPNVLCSTNQFSILNYRAPKAGTERRKSTTYHYTRYIAGASKPLVFTVGRTENQRFDLNELIERLTVVPSGFVRNVVLVSAFIPQNTRAHVEYRNKVEGDAFDALTEYYNLLGEYEYDAAVEDARRKRKDMTLQLEIRSALRAKGKYVRLIKKGNRA
eukprot:318813_1